MDWPYHFVSLTPAQVKEQRILLDRTGYYAWLTPVVFLLAIYTYRRATTPSPDRPPRLVPDISREPPSRLQVQKRRWNWWLDEPLSSEFGARKVHLLGGVYLGCLLFLIFRKTGDDYLHLTKRFGHVAVSQLPFQYMMAIKSWRSPVQLVTGLTWEKRNDYHRLFGRIVHLLAAVHAIMYLNFFVAAGLLSRRLKDWDVRLGLAAFLIFNVLAIMSTPPVRKAAYHSRFFMSHVVTSALLLPILFFHVPYTRKYLYQAFAAYMFNGMARTNSTSVPILSSVKPIEGTSLLKLRIPGPAWGVPPLMGSGTPGWTPGQHVYVKQSVTPKLPRTPFTVVSLPPRETQDGGHESSNIDLVIRNVNGPNTGWLGKKPQETQRIDRNVTIYVEGPYGEASEIMPQLLHGGDSVGSVMLVAGGVGATYTLPIYLSLLQKRHSTRNIRFIWFAKSAREASWGVELLQAATPDVDAMIYLTQESNQGKDEKGGTAGLKNGLQILHYGKRPVMKDIVDDVFNQNAVGDKATKTDSSKNGRVTVLSCGPRGMSASLRTEVRRHVMDYGREVMYHEEAFGHGAS